MSETRFATGDYKYSASDEAFQENRYLSDADETRPNIYYRSRFADWQFEHR